MTSINISFIKFRFNSILLSSLIPIIVIIILQNIQQSIMVNYNFFHGPLSRYCEILSKWLLCFVYLSNIWNAEVPNSQHVFLSHYSNSVLTKHLPFNRIRLNNQCFLHVWMCGLCHGLVPVKYVLVNTFVTSYGSK